VRRVVWVYYDLPHWLAFWKRGARGTNLYYWLWQFGAATVARSIHRKRPFELFHHVTFGRYWVPSMIAAPMAPFVFGPVGGGEDIPSALLRSFRLKSRFMEVARQFLHFISRFDPFLRRSLSRKSTVTVVATPETETKLTLLQPHQVIIMPQCCLDAEKFDQLGNLPAPHSDRFRIVSIGRLVPWKGYHLALKAFAQLLQTFPDAEYWLINDGPDRSYLEECASKLGVNNKVRFLGKLSSLKEVYQVLGQSDVLLHPALRESFGNVCLEAMAAARPVVCLAVGGPGMQVTPDVGIAVRATDERNTVDAFAKALTKLAGDPALREQMGRAAQLRAKQHFSQSAQISDMIVVYRRILKQQKDAVLWPQPL